PVDHSHPALAKLAEDLVARDQVRFARRRWLAGGRQGGRRQGKRFGVDAFVRGRGQRNGGSPVRRGGRIAWLSRRGFAHGRASVGFILAGLVRSRVSFCAWTKRTRSH